MAFSAQTDLGQNERKDAVLCEIGKETSKDKGKVCACTIAFYSAPICVIGNLFLYAKLRRRDCIFVFGALADRIYGFLFFFVLLFLHFVM